MPPSTTEQHSPGHSHSGHSSRHIPSEAKSPVTMPSGKEVEYTCPMHPQIRQTGPGNCPICGMALEPVTGGVEGEPNPELADMTKRFWVVRPSHFPSF